MLPVTISLGLINFNLLINSLFGSLVSDEAPAAIDKAFRVYMLPQGVFSVAIATVLFPTLARFAARADYDGLRSTMANGMRQIMLLLVPAAAAVLVLAFTLARPGGEPRDTALYPPPVIVTGVGEIVTVQLGDGSAVRLAPSSRLRLSAGGDPRAVELEGRAFFSVARDEARPFRVITRTATATVLGTRFEIATEEDDLRLVVVEGRVALETERNRVEVGAGEVSGVTNRVAAEPTRIEDVNDILRWTGRFLAFQNTPLRDAAREIENTYDVRIAIVDEALAARTVTAVFTGQSLESVLDVICAIVNAHCAVRDDEVTMSLR